MNLYYAHMIMAVASLLDTTASPTPKRVPSPEEIQKQHKLQHKSMLARKKKHGLKTFIIGGISVDARNYENALRKVKNILNQTT